MSALLEVHDLQTAYGRSQVLFGVNWQVELGEVATLLGRNGMGKTTTVRSILGLTPAHAGRVRFLGESIESWPSDRIARMGLAVVPEGRQVFANLSVRENLMAFAANRNASAQPWTLERVLHLLPSLVPRLQHMGNQLSGGEQQMVAIGRALMTNPHLLILDEATEGLAPLMKGDPLPQQFAESGCGCVHLWLFRKLSPRQLFQASLFHEFEAKMLKPDDHFFDEANQDFRHRLCIQF
jgi:branched-chain amino acid transport system ATP-binding protein